MATDAVRRAEQRVIVRAERLYVARWARSPRNGERECHYGGLLDDAVEKLRRARRQAKKAK